MRTNILTLLVGFVVMCGLVLLFKVGLDKMTDASAAPTDAYAQVNIDLNRRAILYRVAPGDTLWSLSERFYGNGRRWAEIARANEIPQGQGLQSGAVIKIPLAPGAATPAPEVQPLGATVEPGPEAVAAAVTPGRFAVDDSTLEITLLRADNENFPSGAVCVARITEQQTVTLNIYDAAERTGPAVAVYEAPRGLLLRLIQAEESDGTQNLYTVWQGEDTGTLSRVFGLVDGKLQLLVETPDDPIALARLRAMESR